MKKIFLSAIAGAGLMVGTYAQVSQGGLPTSFEKVEIYGTTPYSVAYETIILATPDMAAIEAEDATKDGRFDNYRAGVNIDISANIMSNGTWMETPNGDLLWRLGIKIPGAQALGLYFNEDVSIPVGGKLHAYNARHSQYIGAYTSSTPTFMAMEMVEGDLITLEYLMPAGSAEIPVINIRSVAYFYRGVEDRIAFFRDGTLEIEPTKLHGSCEVDVACTEITGWTEQRDAVVRYTFEDGGTYLCTASLINNTNTDCTPYILSANHCGTPTTSTAFTGSVWYFNYQRPTCVPGNTAGYTGALSETMSGGIFRASSSWGDFPAGSPSQVDGSDFYLVQMTSNVPDSYGPYFAGWSMATAGSAGGASIHHPAGDEKKISTYTMTLYSTTWNSGWSNAHWGVEWAPTTNGHGVTEGGSSGAPIFDNNNRIVGHLTGGSSFCTSPFSDDLYGKFNRAWDQEGADATERLRPWLDPLGTNPISLDGTYSPCAPSAPVADFVADATVVLPSTAVNFTDLSSNAPDTWAWSVSPATGWSYSGGTTATDQNPQITFTTLGFYTITLDASNSIGSDIETKTDYIEVTTVVGPCAATSSNCDEYISRVELGTIDNTTICLNYFDYTSTESTDMVQSGSGTITVTTLASGGGPGYIDDQVAVWVDWNQDSDFADAGETIGIITYAATTSIPISFTVNVPAGATLGATTMRVRLSYLPDDGPIDPCGTSTWGEVEDYEVVVLASGATVTPAADFVADATTVFEGTVVNFTDLSTNTPTSWLWNITPGTGWSYSASSATDQNPSVLFSTAGTYTVALTATNSAGSDTETKTDYITVTVDGTNIDEDDLSRVEIYPNPTTGQLLVNLNNVTTQLDAIEVRDVTGRLILIKKNIKGNVLLDLSKETDGIYFINIRSSKAVIAKKVVKL